MKNIIKTLIIYFFLLVFLQVNSFNDNRIKDFVFPLGKEVVLVVGSPKMKIIERIKIVDHKFEIINYYRCKWKVNKKRYVGVFKESTLRSLK